METSDFKPHITVRIYNWDFCLRENGAVLSKNDEKDLPWAERRGRELDITDSHLGAIRNLIANVRGLFPEKAPVAPKADPLQETVRVSAQAVV